MQCDDKRMAITRTFISCIDNKKDWLLFVERAKEKKTCLATCVLYKGKTLS